MNRKELKYKTNLLRGYYNHRRLDDFRIKTLNEIEFPWDYLDYVWNRRYDELIKFKNENGHCDVPQSNKEIGPWCATQRTLYKKHKLSQNKIDKLNSIKFLWEVIDYRWNKSYDELIEFKKHNENFPQINEKLGKWCFRQRQCYKKNKLSQDKIDKLNVVEFIWGIIDSWWVENYNELVEFKKQNGHCNVPARPTKLGLWCSNQRKRKLSLSQDQIDKLDILGFIWEPHDSKWNENYNEIIKFKNKNGYFPPQSQGILGTWCNKQRTLYKKHKLSQDRINKLDILGFMWELHDYNWYENYNELVKFKKQNGHCNVPQKSSKLGWWCSIQRQNYKNNILSQDRIDKLNKIGFQWTLRN